MATEFVYAQLRSLLRAVFLFKHHTKSHTVFAAMHALFRPPQTHFEPPKPNFNMEPGSSSAKQAEQPNSSSKADAASDAASFKPSTSFTGPREGYIFTTGWLAMQGVCS